MKNAPTVPPVVPVPARTEIVPVSVEGGVELERATPPPFPPVAAGAAPPSAETAPRLTVTPVVWTPPPLPPLPEALAPPEARMLPVVVTAFSP